jgi:perosamine synthetase
MPPVQLVKPFIGEEEIEAVTRVLRSGQLASGPEVAEFEREFARCVGVRHAVAVNSGTAALHCALEAVGIGPGDEVLTTPFTFAATATPILMQRATPRFVDIDPRTFNVDLDRFASVVTSRTKAIVSVDLFGLPIDNAALGFFRERGIAVIEDACQAIGASRDGAMAGSLMDVACFSLYATKNLMTGEGGVLTTDSDEIASHARRFRQHGQGDRYEYLSLGYNYRMTDLSAAIGRVQLSRLASITRSRRENARRYAELLVDIPGVLTPIVPSGTEHAYHQYSILIDSSLTPNGSSRDDVRATLSDEGIGSGIYYPTPLHLNPLFKEYGGDTGMFPVAERVATQILALPIHPQLARSDLDAVASAIRKAVGAR